MKIIPINMLRATEMVWRCIKMKHREWKLERSPCLGINMVKTFKHWQLPILGLSLLKSPRIFNLSFYYLSKRWMKIKILHSLKTFIIKGFLIENSEIHQIDSQMGRLIKFSSQMDNDFCYKSVLIITWGYLYEKKILYQKYN